MFETKKITASTAATVVALASGLAVGRLSTSMPVIAAHPIALRWLNEGPGKENRYALGVVGQIDRGQFSVEIVCEADGSQPKLNGLPFDRAKAACETISHAGAALNLFIGEIAKELSKPADK